MHTCAHNRVRLGSRHQTAVQRWRVVWVSATDDPSVAPNYITLELVNDHLFSSCFGEPMPLRAHMLSTLPALSSPPRADCRARRICLSRGCFTTLLLLLSHRRQPATAAAIATIATTAIAAAAIHLRLYFSTT